MRRSRDTKLTHIGDIIRESILPGLEPNPADRARERVKAILDAQQRESETERSVRRLRENELIDDPFAEVGR